MLSRQLGQGLTLYGLNVGKSAHADDIRAASIRARASQVQGDCVSSFSNTNSPKLQMWSKALSEANIATIVCVDTYYLAQALEQVLQKGDQAARNNG